MKRYLILFFLLILPLSLYAAPFVKVITIKKRKISLKKEYVAHVEAIRTVDIRPRIEGYLEEVRFKEGDYVKKGEILYVIEQEPYKAEVELSKARVKKAEAHLFRARQRLKRLRAASPESISKTDMDNAIADLMLAKAELSEAKAALWKAKIYLGYTIIRAPISGIIGKSFVKEGNLVSPRSGPLCRIVQIDPIRVVYSVSEADLKEISLSLKKMLKVKIRLPDGSIYPMEGEINFVDNHVDIKTGTISVWAIFPNPDHILIPGMYVTAIPTPKKEKTIILVPQRAVLEDRKGNYVLLVDKENRVQIRRIKIGKMIGSEWEVLSGLFERDRVIVEGILHVRVGQKIKIIK